VHIDAETGERHVADVKTPAGTVLEFQNSPMDIRELRSREHFYRNVLWIVSATGYEFRTLGACGAEVCVTGGKTGREA